MISLLLHETEEERRSSVITMILSKLGYNWLLPNKVKIGNYVKTSCLVNKRVGDNYY